MIIDSEARLARLEEDGYRKLFRVSKATFDVMYEVLETREYGDQYWVHP